MTSSDFTTEERQPSPILREQIHNYAVGFKKYINARGTLTNLGNEILAQGEREGIPREIIHDMVFNEIISLGFSERTARRHLPEELKRKYTLTPAQSGAELSRKLRQNQDSNTNSDKLSDIDNKNVLESEPTKSIAEIEKDFGIDKPVDDSLNYFSPQNYNRDLLHEYDNSQLIGIVRYYENKTDNAIPSPVDYESVRNRIRQLQRENEQLTREAGIRNKLISRLDYRIIQLKVQLKRAGLTPVIGKEAAAA